MQYFLLHIPQDSGLSEEMVLISRNSNRFHVGKCFVKHQNFKTKVHKIRRYRNFRVETSWFLRYLIQVWIVTFHVINAGKHGIY